LNQNILFNSISLMRVF